VASRSSEVNFTKNYTLLYFYLFIIMVHNGMSSSYRSVNWIPALILLGLAVYLPSTSVSSLFMVLYIFNFFFITFPTLPFNELSLVGLALDLVGCPSSFGAVTLLVGSSDP